MENINKQKELEFHNLLYKMCMNYDGYYTLEQAIKNMKAQFKEGFDEGMLMKYLTNQVPHFVLAGEYVTYAMTERGAPVNAIMKDMLTLVKNIHPTATLEGVSIRISPMAGMTPVNMFRETVIKRSLNTIGKALEYRVLKTMKKKLQKKTQ